MSCCNDTPIVRLANCIRRQLPVTLGLYTAAGWVPSHAPSAFPSLRASCASCCCCWALNPPQLRCTRRPVSGCRQSQAAALLMALRHEVRAVHSSLLGPLTHAASFSPSLRVNRSSAAASF
jgi:hypothetical protein